MTQTKGHCHCKKVSWVYNGDIESVTACNCTLCSRYGALWAYGHENDEITLDGSTNSYIREQGANGFHFCTNCGCLAYYKSLAANAQGKFRVAVNTRMAVEPEKISKLPIDHFDGLNKFEDLPSDGKRVEDIWF